jgi:hypothetical protein
MVYWGDTKLLFRGNNSDVSKMGSRGGAPNDINHQKKLNGLVITAEYSLTCVVAMTAVCGTGLSTRVSQPGDPDFAASILSAQQQLGGIRLYWTYPLTNPHAVAHTLVYRAITADYATSVHIAVAAGNTYLDPYLVEDHGTTYYYWIKMISINGTEGDVIGPASATAQPSAEELLKLMIGKLSASQLNDELTASIGNVANFESSLTAEQRARLDADGSLAAMAAQLQSEIGVIDAVFKQGREANADIFSAITNEFNLQLSKIGSNAAAIQVEKTTRVTNYDALAATIETISAATASSSVSIQELKTVSTGDGAQWTLKLDANGKISGISARNDGERSEVFIKSDVFAIVHKDKKDELVYPFIVDVVNGESVIALNAKALIPDAQITNAMVGNYIASNDYEFGEKGWGIFKEFWGYGGYAEFNNIKARGNIEATSIKAGSVNIIDTLMVQGQAITFSSGTRCASGRTNSSSQIIFDGTFNPEGGKLQLIFTSVVKSEDGGLQVVLKINDKQVQITKSRIRADKGVDTSWELPISLQFTTGAVNTFQRVQIYVEQNGSPASWSDSYLTATELKR